MDLPEFASNDPFGDLTKLFGRSEPTSADPEDLARVELGVEAWNAFRPGSFKNPINEMALFVQRPNLIGAKLGGPKWDPNDISRMSNHFSELADSPTFSTAASYLVDRWLEFMKDQCGEDLLAEFPEAVRYFSASAGTVNIEPQLKSTAFLEFYLQHSKSDLSRWFEPLWSIAASRDLRGINFRGTLLRNANLRGADLRGSDLSHADCRGADLSWADLSGAHLRDALLDGATLLGSAFVGADLRNVAMSNADLEGVKLREANLTDAKLANSNLRDADLTGAIMMRTNMENSILIGARVYGISVWDTRLSGAIQTDVVVTPLGQPDITVDSIEVAQFIYLLINNARIRDAIDAISSKAVLVLGRFTPARKATLDALRVTLRTKNYLPIVFDFEKPRHRDFTETVSTLAHLSRFVIADLTDPRSIPQELTAIIPRLLSVPICPLLRGAEAEWSMFSDLQRYPQVMRPVHYEDDQMLLACLDNEVITSAEQRTRELLENKRSVTLSKP